MLLLDQGLLKALLITVELPGLPLLRRPLRPAHRRRPARAVRPHAAGAGRDVARPGGALLLVPALIIGRGVFVIAAILVIVAHHRLAPGCSSGRRSTRRPRERLLIVGTNPAADRSWRASCTTGAPSSASSSSASSTPTRRGPASGRRRRASSARIDDIPRSSKSLAVDRVVVSLTDARGKLPMDKLLDMRMAGVSFAHLPVGVRGVHGQDRRREPAAELAHLLGRLHQGGAFGGAKRTPRPRRDRALLLLLSLPLMAVAGRSPSS